MRTLLSRIRALFRHSRLDEDLDADIRAHLDLLESDYVKRGATPEAARLAARRAFGGVQPMKEIHRDRRGIPLIETVVQDVRHALRVLRHHRGFTAIAVVSLALGIGATTARETLTVVGVGVVIGVAGALASSRFVAAFVFGLTATDPLSIAGSAVVLMLVAAFAGYLPARRAASVRPLLALRAE